MMESGAPQLLQVASAPGVGSATHRVGHELREIGASLHAVNPISPCATGAAGEAIGAV